ncbi:hypothetical protein YB2330_001242 [Saitoella coloradoensis]
MLHSHKHIPRALLLADQQKLYSATVTLSDAALNTGVGVAFLMTATSTATPEASAALPTETSQSSGPSAIVITVLAVTTLLVAALFVPALIGFYIYRHRRLAASKDGPGTDVMTDYQLFWKRKRESGDLIPPTVIFSGNEKDMERDGQKRAIELPGFCIPVVVVSDADGNHGARAI